MRKLNLRLDNLRTLRIPLLGAVQDNPLAPAFKPPELTRRALLGILGASIGGKALASSHGTMTWGGDRDTWTFFVDGQPCWRIRTYDFDGRPELRATETPKGLDLSLSRALYPGTDLSADFTAHITRANWWRMDLRTKSIGFCADIDLVRWLRELEPAEFVVPTPRMTIRVGPTESVEISGPATAFFTPIWRTEIVGAKIVRLQGFGPDLPSDRLTLALLESEEPSILDMTLARRFAIQVYRGSAVWHLAPGMPHSKRGELIVPPNAFDVVTVESGTTSAGKVASAAVARNVTGDRALRFRPTEKLSLSGRKPFSFPLQNAIYSRTMHGSVRHEAVLGTLPEGEVWVHGQGFSAELTTRGDDRTAQITAVNGCVQQCRITPRVKSVAAALADAIVMPGQPCGLEKDKGSDFPWYTIFSRKKRKCLPMNINKHRLIRSWDHLDLEFEFGNLELVSGKKGKAHLVPIDATKPCPVTVWFPPQHIAEQAFFEIAKITVRRPIGKGSDPDTNTPKSEEPPPPPVSSRITGRSRLVFVLPNKATIPWTIEDLLNWKTWTPCLPERATSDDPVGPATPVPVPEPKPGQTAIEAPYRLILSPVPDMGWAHRGVLICTPEGKSSQQVELWHTRMAALRNGNLDESDTVRRAVRAVYSPDYTTSAQEPAPCNVPFRMSMNAMDRHEIVRLSADFGINTAGHIHTAPIHVNRFLMSAWGAWMDFHGTWDPPNDLNVEEWVQISTEGHDHYVRVVYKGYLYPFGHRVSLVKVTERKFTFRDDHYVAYEKQRMYIVNRQKDKAYPAVGQPFNGRQLPFQTLSLLTKQTPDLDDPLAAGTPGGPIDASLKEYNFWPSASCQIYQFEWKQLCSANQSSTVQLPAIFLDNSLAHRPPAPTVQQSYQQHIEWRRANLNGQTVGYTANTKPADTDYQTRMFTYTAVFPDAPVQDELQSVDQPPFYPAMESADVRLTSVERMTGAGEIIRTIQYYDTYLSQAFGAQNTGEVFAAILAGQDPVYVQFSGPSAKGDRSGGSVSPNARVIGLSRSHGPVCGQPATTGSVQLQAAATPGPVSGGPALDSMASGKFDPVDYFAGAFADATILGVIKLWSVLRPLVESAASNLDEAPKLVENIAYDLGQLTSKVSQTIRDIANAVDQQAAKLGPLQQRIHPYCSKISNLLDQIQQQQNALAQFPLWTQLVQTAVALGSEIGSIAQNPSALAQQAAEDIANGFLAGVQGQLLPFLNEISKIRDAKEPLLKAKASVDAVLSALSASQQLPVDIKAAVVSLIQKEQKRLAAMFDEFKQSADALVKEITLAPQVAWGKTWSSILSSEAAFLRSLGTLRAELKQLSQLSGFFASADEASKLVGAMRSNLGDSYASLTTHLQMVALTYRSQLETEFAKLSGVSDQAKSLVKTVDDDLTALQDLGNNQGWPSDIQNDVRVAILRTQASFVRHMNALATALGVDPHANVAAAATGPEGLWAMIRGWRTELTLADPHVVAGGTAQTWQTRLMVLVNQLNSLSVVPASLSQEVTAMAAAVDASFKAGMYEEVLDTLGSLAERGGTLYSLLSGIQYGDTSVGAALKEIAADVSTAESAALAYEAGAKIAVDGLLAQISTLIGTLQAAQAAVKSDLQSQLTELQDKLTTASQQLVQTAADAATDALVSVLPPLIDVVAEIAQRLLVLVAGALPFVAEALALKQQVDDLVSQIAIPAEIHATYAFQPKVQSFPGGDKPLFEVLGDSSDTLIITTDIIAHLPVSGVAKAPEVNISGQLKNFAINLAGSELWFLTIAFDHFNLTSANGGPPKFDVKIAAVEFGDCLNFIKDLAKALDPSEGPFLEFLGVKIQAGFRFQLPTIAVGAFAMRDLRILVEAAISLVGDPMRVRIGISDRQQPFLIQVGIFGGGGFFAMELGLDGVQAMEGALEFGVTASISIGGVANGFGYIMAGIYFSIEKVPAGNGTTRDKTTLCGFVRAGGHLSIIGLISMNLDIYVDLCYVSDGAGHNLVRGSAEVDIEIDIFFFSVTVTIHADYTFSGSDDPQHTQRQLSARTLPEARELLEALRRDQLDLDSADDWRHFRDYFVPVVPLQV